MTTDRTPSWVLPLVCGYDNEKIRSNGSGILVSPNHVMTCWHVVCPWKHTEQDQFENEVPFPFVGIKINGQTIQTAAPTRPVWRTEDMVVLKLNYAVKNDSYPTFLVGMNDDSLSKMLETREYWKYAGWTSPQEWNRGGLRSLTQYNLREQLGFALQLEGGIPNGCSGGALLLEKEGAEYCAGMWTLGGFIPHIGHEMNISGASTSFAFSSDWLVDELEKEGLDMLQKTSLSSLVPSFKDYEQSIILSITIKHRVRNRPRNLTNELSEHFVDIHIISSIVSEAETLLKDCDPQSKPLPLSYVILSAGAYQAWDSILTQGSLVGPRALAAVLLTAKSRCGVSLAAVDEMLKILTESKG